MSVKTCPFHLKSDLNKKRRKRPTQYECYTVGKMHAPMEIRENKSTYKFIVSTRNYLCVQ
jgi:hypothetical protein